MFRRMNRNHISKMIGESEMKNLKSKTLELFPLLNEKNNNAIRLKSQRNELMDQLIQIKKAITIKQKKDEFAEVLNLKRKYRDLEGKLLDLEEMALDSNEYHLSDQEVDEFKIAFNNEMSVIIKSHDIIRGELNQKIDEIVDVYRKLINTQELASERRGRMSAVERIKQAPGELAPINNKSNFYINGRTSPEDIGQILRDRLAEVSPFYSVHRES